MSCHSYVTCMYSYAICMSLVCTCLPSVCQSYVLICHPYVTRMFIYLFIYLFNNLFEVDKFTKIQYTYIHKSSQTNWLIKVNYPVLQENSSNRLIKTKEKEKEKKAGL